MPFGLGPTELILVMLVLLLVFGAKRLPDLGAGLGKGIREFKRSISEINKEVERPLEDDARIQPSKRPPAVPPITEKKDESISS
jgi:sec-independent protein translocase protein TatA